MHHTWKQLPKRETNHQSSQAVKSFRTEPQQRRAKTRLFFFRFYLFFTLQKVNTNQLRLKRQSKKRCGITVRPASHHSSTWSHSASQFRWGDPRWNTYHRVARNSETRHQTSSLGQHTITAWCNCWLSWEVSLVSAAPEEEQKSNFMTAKKVCVGCSSTIYLDQ